MAVDVRDLPSELIQRILRWVNSLRSSIAVELLFSYPQPFWIRISRQPDIVRDAIHPLLPPQWSRLGPDDFPISMMQASEIVLLRWSDVATIPAYVVAWIARFAPQLLSYDFVTAAARAGRLDLLRLIHAFEIPKFCAGTMDAAAKAGRFSIVHFLHFERNEGCTVHAMDGAIESGYLDVAQFLGTHRTELCTRRALYAAIRNGDLDTVRFLQGVVKCEPEIQEISFVTDLTMLKVLHEELGWPITGDVVKNMATHGADAVRYCLERFPRCKADAVRGLVCSAACSVETLAVLNEFFPTAESLWSSSNWDSVAQSGSLPHLEWLYANRTEGCTAEIMNTLSLYPRPDVIEFLETKGFERKPPPAWVFPKLTGIPTPFFQTNTHWAWQMNTPLPVPMNTPLALQTITHPQAHPPPEFAFGALRSHHTVHAPALAFPSDSRNIDAGVILSAVENGEFIPVTQLYLALASATKSKGMETIKRLSDLTPQLTVDTHDANTAGLNLYQIPATLGRLDVIRYFHANRSERPNSWVLRAAVEYGHIEVVRYLCENMGMQVTSDLFLSAPLEVIPYLLDRLPASLGLPIMWACSRESVELLRFLHKRGRGMVDLFNAFDSSKSLDVVEELLNVYGNQLDDVSLKDIVFRCSFDAAKLVLESETGKHRKVGLRNVLGSRNPDLIFYALENNRCYVEDAFYFPDSYFGPEFPYHQYLYDDLADPSHLSFLNLAAGTSNSMLFARLFARYPTQCTTRTAELAARSGSLAIVLFLSKHAPRVMAESVVTNAIEGRCVFHIVEHLLRQFPACRNPRVHLEAATRVRKGMMAGDRPAVVTLLMGEDWDGACPTNLIMTACRLWDAELIRAFVEKANMDDEDWRSAVEWVYSFIGKRKKGAEKYSSVRTLAKKLLDGFQS
ncbi:hypothetical protein HDU96_005725 [Phlyctochytrium bullatum]|nr:hypothetical protein HDU96_005725 [Phlyctochytrium bullatum]